MEFVLFVERIFDDEIFEKIKAFIEKHTTSRWDLPFRQMSKVSLYCLTPANYELAKSEQGYTGTKDQLSRIMAKRYKELEWMGIDINLHLHLSLRPDKLPEKKENQMLKEAMGWMRKHRFDPKEIMFGWYLYTDRSIKIANKHGLKLNKNLGKYHLHDYELDHPYRLMLILQNLRGLLR